MSALGSRLDALTAGDIPPDAKLYMLGTLPELGNIFIKRFGFIYIFADGIAFPPAA